MFRQQSDSELVTKKLNMKLVKEVLENTCLSWVAWLQRKKGSRLNWYSFCSYKFWDDDMKTFVWRKKEKKPENIYREALQIM